MRGAAVVAAEKGPRAGSGGRAGSCTEGGEICKLLLPHGCSIRSIHIEMRPARASSAAGRCHASARPAACQLGQWGWQDLAALGARPGGGRGSESATPVAQAPQPLDPGLHREWAGRKDRDAQFQKGGQDRCRRSPQMRPGSATLHLPLLAPAGQ